MRAASGTAPGGSGAIGESSVISGSGDKRAGHEDDGVGLDAAAAGGCAAGRGGCAGRCCARGQCRWFLIVRWLTQNSQPAQYTSVPRCARCAGIVAAAADGASKNWSALCSVRVTRMSDRSCRSLRNRSLGGNHFSFARERERERERVLRCTVLHHIPPRRPPESRCCAALRPRLLSASGPHQPPARTARMSKFSVGNRFSLLNQSSTC